MKLQEIEVGKEVLYHPVIKDNGEKIGTKQTKIKSEAWEIGGGDIVCLIEDVSGGVLISHLEEIL